MNFKFDRFKIDRNLIFVIQNCLNESSEEILIALHEYATSVVTECLKSSRAQRLDKKCKFFYKKGKIPVMLTAWSINYESHQKHSPDKPLAVHIEIKFPNNTFLVSVEQLEALASEKFEKSLGLRDETTRLVDFDKPEIKVPRSLKGVL